jgi:hypothetical protein
MVQLQKFEVNEMGAECSLYEAEGKYIQGFGGEA